MFAGDVEALVADPNGLSEYEIERVERIRRNREIMKRLGLGDSIMGEKTVSMRGGEKTVSTTKKLLDAP